MVAELRIVSPAPLDVVAQGPQAENDWYARYGKYVIVNTTYQTQNPSGEGRSVQTSPGVGYEVAPSGRVTFLAQGQEITQKQYNAISPAPVKQPAPSQPQAPPQIDTRGLLATPMKPMEFNRPQGTTTGMGGIPALMPQYDTSTGFISKQREMGPSLVKSDNWYYTNVVAGFGGEIKVKKELADMPFQTPLIAYRFAEYGGRASTLKEATIVGMEVSTLGLSLPSISAALPFIGSGAGKVVSVGVGETTRVGDVGLVEAKFLTRSKGLLGGKNYVSDVKLQYEIPKTDIEISRGVAGIATKEVKRAAPIAYKEGGIIESKTSYNIQFNKAKVIYKEGQYSSSVVEGINYKFNVAKGGVSSPGYFGGGLTSIETPAGMSINVGKFIAKPSGTTTETLSFLRPKGASAAETFAGTHPGTISKFDGVSDLATAHIQGVAKSIERNIPQNKIPSLVLPAATLTAQKQFQISPQPVSIAKTTNPQQVSLKPASVSSTLQAMDSSTLQAMDTSAFVLPKTRLSLKTGQVTQTATLQGIDTVALQRTEAVTLQRTETATLQRTETQTMFRTGLLNKEATNITIPALPFGGGYPSGYLPNIQSPFGTNYAGIGRRQKTKPLRKYTPSLIGLYSGKKISRKGIPKRLTGLEIRLPVKKRRK